MKNNSKVLFLPKWDEANPYQRLLSSNIRENSCEVFLDNYDSGYFPISTVARKYKKEKGVNVVHLHWISDIAMRICWAKNPIVFYLKYSLFCLDLMLCKLMGLKIVWTIHNKLSHDSEFPQKELLLRKTLSKFADKLILHSQEAADVVQPLYQTKFNDKLAVIRHGNYDGCYPKPSDTRAALRAKHNIEPTQKVYLNFGSIKPYKGVEMLIDAANQLKDNSDIKFIIAGEPNTKQYQATLKRSIKSAQIHTDFNFLSDQDMVDYITLADAILLPFANTLTSGSAILAMTFGKALILPETGKVFGCVNDQGGYFFKNLEHLVSILSAENSETLAHKGQVNAEAAQTMNWAVIAKSTCEKCYA